MHVHFNQTPNQLDALYNAARAEANREAARTRKKLSEFASKLTAALDCGENAVAGLEAREESQQQTQHQDRADQNQSNQSQPNRDGRRKEDGGAASVAAQKCTFDWL